MLVGMENFLQGCPPFAFFAIRQGFLQGHGMGPPFLGLRLSRQPGHIGLIFISHVFEVAEEIMLFIGQFAQINGIIPDASLVDDFQHFGPDRPMQCDVIGEFAGGYLNDSCVTTHNGNELKRVVCVVSSFSTETGGIVVQTHPCLAGKDG